MASIDDFAPLNLQDVIAKYAWQQFMIEKRFPLKMFYRKSRYYVDIKWSHVVFKHDTSVRNGLRPGNEKTGSPQDVVLHFSEFENRTPLDQHYTFSTSRETCASTSIEFQETYSMGAETSIEVSLGDIVTVGAGLSGSLEVTETKGQNFEESMTWEVNTEISVKQGHKAKANLCVYETTTVCDFDVTTTMSLLSGKLPVAIKRKSNNKIVYVILITNLEKVFGSCVGPNIKVNETYDEKTNKVDYIVEILSHGTCKSVSWKNQHVKVESIDIKDLPGVKALAENGISKDGK